MSRNYHCFGYLFAVAVAMPAAAIGPQAEAVQRAWDNAQFGLDGDESKTAMKKLVAECESLVTKHAEDAEVLTWCGITNSTFAGMVGALSAMKYAKAAKANLEKAIELAPDVVNGGAKSSLGTLYFKVPGWPIGFGNDDKARELLTAGLAINPEGIDSNYFYADFLIEEKDFASARIHLERALAAPARPGREIADEGRRADVQASLLKLD
ncbi:MAG: tetratricopeptide repeat protein [Halioglobus sp.]